MHVPSCERWPSLAQPQLVVNHQINIPNTKCKWWTKWKHINVKSLLPSGNSIYPYPDLWIFQCCKHRRVERQITRSQKCLPHYNQEFSHVTLNIYQNNSPDFISDSIFFWMFRKNQQSRKAASSTAKHKQCQTIILTL